MVLIHYGFIVTALDNNAQQCTRLNIELMKVIDPEYYLSYLKLQQNTTRRSCSLWSIPVSQCFQKANLECV